MNATGCLTAWGYGTPGGMGSLILRARERARGTGRRCALSPASAQRFSGNHVRGLTHSGLALLLWTLMFQAAAAEQPRPDRWRLKAQELEKRGAWLEACRCYEEILRKDRNNPAARDGYQRC